MAMYYQHVDSSNEHFWHEYNEMSRMNKPSIFLLVFQTFLDDEYNQRDDIYKLNEQESARFQLKKFFIFRKSTTLFYS